MKEFYIITLNLLKIYLFPVLIFATLTLKAQTILVDVGTGGGTFEMNSTKEFNQTIVHQLPFKPVLTNNFPPYFFYKAEVIYCFPEKLAIGITLSTTSTGSRLTLADYSGKYRFDNTQTGLFPGIKLLFGKAPGRSNGFNVSLEAGVAFSTMTVDEEMKVFADSTTDNMELKAMGIYVQPGIYYFRNIGSRVKVSANISYYYGIEKGYHLPKARGQRLINTETEKPVKPQWDGIRFGISAYWCFRNGKK